MYKDPLIETQSDIHTSYNMSSTPNTYLPVLRYPSHTATPELEDLALIITRGHEVHEQHSHAPTPKLANKALNIARIHKQHKQTATHAAMVAQSIILNITVQQAIRAFG